MKEKGRERRKGREKRESKEERERVIQSVNKKGKGKRWLKIVAFLILL